MSDNAKIEFNGKSLECPIVTGTENEKALDISKLRGETGAITIDPGFVNTGSCVSEITFLNGEKGILRYRGYPIEQLADSSTFLETSLLLFNGELPKKTELDSFENKVKKQCDLPEPIFKMLDQFPKDAHPMGVLISSISALSAFYPEYAEDVPAEKRDDVLAQLMGQVKVIMAYFYRKSSGKEFVKSDSSLNYSEDFLNMMFGKFDKEVADALNVLLILHADHEQNCSASTVRVIGSGHANIFATVSGGVSALWGKLHGGANQAVLEMLDEINKDGGDHYKFLEKAKSKEDPFRLMGFGHRVYKNFDPRAKIIKQACDTILKKLGVEDPLLDIAKGLEQEALKDEYFVKRNLYPNVDFYSGIIYRALGIPVNMFTAMFVLGRLPGWMSQWKEMREMNIRISRPRQIYTGENERDYVPVDKR